MLRRSRSVRIISVWSKLIVACGLFALGTGLVGVFAIWAHSSTNGALQGVLDQNVSTVAYLQQAQRDMLEALVAERSLIFMKIGTPDAQAMVKEHEDNLVQVEEGWKKYMAIPASAAGKELRAPFEAAWMDWKKTTTDVLKILAVDTPMARNDAKNLSMGKSTANFAKARDNLDKVTNACHPC